MKLGLLALVVLVAFAVRGKPAAALALGEEAGPVAMVNLEGHPRVMNNYGERACTVVAFLSARCDATLAQLENLNVLSRSDDRENMVIVAVFPNKAEANDEIKSFLQSHGACYPAYRDPDGKVVKAFGAKVTPEFYLLDKTGKLVYRGNFGGLELAARALLVGAPVEIEKTPAKGTPIGKSGPKRDLEDPFGTIAFSSELVFTHISGAPVHHCSTIAEAGNGDLLCLWYGGSYESSEDQVLFLSRQKKGERTWSVPEVVVRNPDMPPGNAIIFKDTIGRLWMVWGRMEGSRPARRGTGWSHCRLMIRTSKDNGYTWSEEREWPDSFSWLPRNPPITLTNGQLVLPMSLNNPLESGGVLLRLNPDNETWSRLGYMPDGEQMTVIHRTNGSLFALGRSQPYMLGSESADGGVTWSKPVQTPLKCPDSGNCMIRLASGRLVLAHNDCNGEDRANLAIQQSEDEGKSWVKQKFLEVEPNLEEGEYSYPCLIQTSDGMIHITYTCRRYTIKHAAFSEGWLTNLSRPN